MDNKMNIFFSVNSNAMLGLGTAVVSLIKNCTFTENLCIWFLCNSLNHKDKHNIIELLNSEKFKGISKFIDYDADKEFGFLKSYHGDRTTYGRFLVPQLIDCGFAYYLDTDIVINIDILLLKSYESKKAISAVERRQFKDSKERLLFEHLKLNLDTSYFNAGVLILNIKQWHHENISNKIVELGNTPNLNFCMADQSLLNAVIAGNYTKIPKHFNFPYPPSKEKICIQDNMIIHFIGSPKPWDIYASFIHNGYYIWKIYQTPFWLAKYDKISWSRIKRTWAIRNQYLKRKKKIFNKFKEILNPYH